MNLKILLTELEHKTSRSSGPGGQHVNKTESRVEIHWNLRESKAVSDYERILLLSRLSNKLTTEGKLIVSSEMHRSQLKNKEDARQKLVLLITTSLQKRKKRIATHPTKSSIEKRISVKKKRAQIKRNRKIPLNDL